MLSDTGIPFSKLPTPARQHVYLFQGHQFLDRFAMGLMVAVMALALKGRVYAPALTALLSELTR